MIGIQVMLVLMSIVVVFGFSVAGFPEIGGFILVMVMIGILSIWANNVHQKQFERKSEPFLSECEHHTPRNEKCALIAVPESQNQ